MSEVENLLRFATADSLNSMIEQHYKTTRPTISTVSAGLAQMPYLEDGASRNAWHIDIEVTSAEDAEIAVPRHLMLKVGRDTAGQARQEILFYELARDAGLPIAQCYGTAWLEDKNLALVLMEKVPADFFYQGANAQHLVHYEQALRSLARLHAWHWNHPSIGTGRFEYQWNHEFLDSIIVLIEAGFAKIKMSNHLVDLAAIEKIGEVIKQLPSLCLARVRNGGPMCINHGDAGLWNFMFREGLSATVKMLDFPQWCVNPPAWDLMYMTALDWPTEFRRAHQGALFDAYNETLISLGIVYPPEIFDRDIKLCALGMTGVALVSLATGVRSIDEAAEEVSRLMAVFDDYGALEILG
ncbi:MAG: hypothetical protein ACJAYE_003627 [Candidatus Azotimanducaceae bacterium]|jgi:hypothetical protein